MVAAGMPAKGYRLEATTGKPEGPTLKMPRVVVFTAATYSEPPQEVKERTDISVLIEVSLPMPDVTRATPPETPLEVVPPMYSVEVLVEPPAAP